MNNVQVMVNYWQQENSLASPNFINFMRIQRHLQISQIATVSYSQSPGEGGYVYLQPGRFMPLWPGWLGGIQSHLTGSDKSAKLAHLPRGVAVFPSADWAGTLSPYIMYAWCVWAGVPA